MPDITMCWNKTCPLRDKCYRYRAIPDKYWQSFAEFRPNTINIGTETITECDHFWNIEKTGCPILPTEEVDKRNKGGDNEQR